MAFKQSVAETRAQRQLLGRFGAALARGVGSENENKENEIWIGECILVVFSWLSCRVFVAGYDTRTCKCLSLPLDMIFL